ncbi:MAG: CPBP family intramembrane glutamic endopeptidase [Leptospiraceae bacterium]|nr:CPBP family intramembrane glutamic endopeptidase [Leptospiraceae bacterium]
MFSIILFSILIASLGWIGFYFDISSNNKDYSNGLGALLMILSPLAIPVLFLIFKRIHFSLLGIQLNLKENLKFYILSIFLFPTISVFIIILGYLTNSFTLEWKSMNSQFIFLIITTSLLKNIFEEIGWRGFLAPSLKLHLKNDYLIHLFTNLVWISWHLPYWFYFIPETEFSKFTTLTRIDFAICSSLSLLVGGIVYNELRFITNSIFPSYILHVIHNITTGILLSSGMIVYTPISEVILGLNGILVTSVLFFMGIYLNVYRKKYMPNINATT